MNLLREIRDAEQREQERAVMGYFDDIRRTLRALEEKPPALLLRVCADELNLAVNELDDALTECNEAEPPA